MSPMNLRVMCICDTGEVLTPLTFARSSIIGRSPAVLGMGMETKTLIFAMYAPGVQAFGSLPAAACSFFSSASRALLAAALPLFLAFWYHSLAFLGSFSMPIPSS